MDIPVYLINGFLGSGKSTFIDETIRDGEFSKKYKTLLIQCEEGEVELDEGELKKMNIDLATVDDADSLTGAFFAKCENKYKPHRVLIEYNGMWKMEGLLGIKLPRQWSMAQKITIIDASTYAAYLLNMRQIMMEQVKYSDLVVFNRCSDDINKFDLRRSIVAVNRRVSIIYMGRDGDVQDIGEDIMPFDMDADIIEITDDDYGIWIMDIMGNPQKYNGKTVRYMAMVYKPPKLPRDYILAGRLAMTCCANDVAFMGLPCKAGRDNAVPLGIDELVNKQYINITGKVCYEFYKEYKGKGPVLYASSIEDAREPEDAMIYFN